MIRQAALAIVLAATISAPALAQVPGFSPGGGTVGAGPDCSGPGCFNEPGPEQNIPPGYHRPYPPETRPPVHRPPSGYYRPYPRDDYHYYNERVSCREAERIIRRSGYNSVRAIDCSGRYYHFYAKRRGRAYEVTIRSANGHIVSVERI